MVKGILEMPDNTICLAVRATGRFMLPYLSSGVETVKGEEFVLGFADEYQQKPCVVAIRQKGTKTTAKCGIFLFTHDDSRPTELLVTQETLFNIGFIPYKFSNLQSFTDYLRDLGDAGMFQLLQKLFLIDIKKLKV